MPDIAHSVCPHDCPSTCALEVERLDAHRIGRIRGAAANSYTDGVICAKVARYAERLHHPDRLGRPLRRVGAKGEGKFEPIAWDDALDLVAERFLEAERRHGPEAVWPYFYAGTMGLVQRDGINRLRHAKRYSGFISTICVTTAYAGVHAGLGKLLGADPREMIHSDVIVVWGGNPVSTQVNVMHWIAKARKTRGAKLVVIDPYRTPTAEQADLHLMLRPGTDGALAVAVMHVLFREGYADRDFLARYTDAPEALEEHVALRGPQWAAAITGLSVAEIEDFARLYGRSKKSFIRIGYGFTRSRNGAVAMHAVTCLPAVTGAWKEQGGGALFGLNSLYHWDKTLIEGLDVADRTVRGLDQSRIGPVLLGDKADLGDGPPVTALLIQNTNPVAVALEQGKVLAGFRREDLFTCVHEQFMTDTARHADVVLPATMFLEHDDVYQASGHPHIQVARKVVEPFAESRSNHDVIVELAKRVGARHRGFDMSAWDLIDETLRVSGWPDAATIHAAHWHDVATDFRSMHFLDGFGHPDGRFRFRPDWAAIGPLVDGMPSLPDHFAVIEEADAEHPFRLVAAPARNFLNSTFTETATSRKKERRPTALVHPEDLAELGVASGDRIRLGNARADLTVEAKAFDGLRRGVIVVESIWPAADYPDGLGVNALIGADPAPPARGAAIHDTKVWIRPAA
ncbi:MAG: molybdopterin oxidoreductase family protein [Alphaproteobacteria bacterium]|nr:molybdopterin oxidoreductase family protein [Alphaproteobacteria bacterium]